MATKDLIAAVMMVKDEADVIAEVVAHWFTQGIDFMIVADNLSSDGTLQILQGLEWDYPVTTVIDDDPAYYQSRKMTALAHKAYAMGADWIIPCDADELWYAWNGKTVATELRETNQQVIGVPLWDHRCTSRDKQVENPFKRMVYRAVDHNPLDKVCYRYHEDWTIAQGNHGVLNAAGQTAIGYGLSIGIRHFPYRSPEQFIRKARNGAAAYKQTDLPDSTGKHWRLYGEWLEQGGEQVLHDHFAKWFYAENPEASGLIYDPAPFKSVVKA